MAESLDTPPIVIDEDEVPFLDFSGKKQATRSASVSLSGTSIIGDLLRKASNYKLHYQVDAHRQHQFIRTSFYKPTHCQHCGDIIWGLHKQGFNCIECSFRCHERCMDSVVVPCLIMKLSALRKPNSHWFKKINLNKRVYCNVCRHKIVGQGLRCELCKYYTHNECTLYSVPDCLDSSTYNEYYGSMLNSSMNPHHWVEGNLPSTAKCVICHKNCGHQDCLMDVRCVRCGFLAHAYCLPKVEHICALGLLSRMFLSSTVVTVMRRGDDSVTPIQGTKTELRFVPGMDQPPLLVAEGVQGTPLSEETDIFEMSLKLDEMNVPDRLIKVWDFSHDNEPAVNGRQTKTIKVFENQTAGEVLVMILKKFRLFGYPSNYYLIIPACPEDQVPEDDVLSPEVHLYQLQSRKEQLCLHLKFRKDEGDTYALRIHTNIKLADAETVVIDVKPSMTVVSVIKEAVKGFHVLTGTLSLGECYIHKYLCQGSLFHLERLDPGEEIWNVITEDRKHIFSRSRFTRYFLKKQLIEEFCVAVTKLPPGKTEEEYRDMLIPEEMREKVCIAKLLDIHGFVVLKCMGDKAVDDICGLINMSVERSPTLVLPTIHSEYLDTSIHPLLVFVNSRSGGGQGKELISSLRRHLNPHQIFDLSHGGPYPGLYTFKDFENFRILICGGDGTYGWVLQALDETQPWRKCAKPCCALIPLGTGNDLARAFNWGGGYSGEKAMEFLTKIDSSYPIEFDRWTMVFDCRRNPHSPIETVDFPLMENNKLIVMNNYFGIGCDAEVSLAFHEARERHPERFSSRIYNKFQYAKLGAELLIDGQTYNLTRDLELRVDDEVVDIPVNIVGLIVLNINSWGAGGDGWGAHTDIRGAHPDVRFQPQEMNDGKLEVAGLTGSFHMVQIQKGLGNGIRLAQGGDIRISTKAAFPVQVDGEPWRAPAGIIKIFPQMQKSNILMHTERRSAPRMQKSVSADIYV